jgi:hypothetical protein
MVPKHIGLAAADACELDVEHLEVLQSTCSSLSGV